MQEATTMADGQAVQKQQVEAKTQTAEQLEAEKKWVQIVAQARADKTLKQRLIDTPTAVLKEYGINVGEGLDIRVVENTDKVVYLTLPAVSELSDRELDGVVGGTDVITGTLTDVARAAKDVAVIVGLGAIRLSLG
jgi:hypothetical protein